MHSLDLTEALILVGMNQVEAGIDVLERIVAQDPTNVPAWQSLVKLMIARGEADEALRRVEVAVAVHPSTAEFYALLANLHASLGDPSSAEAAQRQLVDRVEGTAARISVANQLHAAGKTDMAMEVLDAARAQDSTSDAANVAYLRVAFLLDDGRMQKARSRFEEFEQAFSGDIRGEYLRARFEFAEGNAQAAAARQGRQYYQLALEDERRNELAAAARNLQTALTFEPDNGHFREKLARHRQALK